MGNLIIFDIMKYSKAHFVAVAALLSTSSAIQ